MLSEALKPAPAAERSTVFTMTITQAELFYGVEVLRPGARRTQLMESVEKIFAEEFGGRILPFDEIDRAVLSSRSRHL